MVLVGIKGQISPPPVLFGNLGSKHLVSKQVPTLPQGPRSSSPSFLLPYVSIIFLPLSNALFSSQKKANCGWRARRHCWVSLTRSTRGKNLLMSLLSPPMAFLSEKKKSDYINIFWSVYPLTAVPFPKPCPQIHRVRLEAHAR